MAQKKQYLESTSSIFHFKFDLSFNIVVKSTFSGHFPFRVAPRSGFHRLLQPFCQEWRYIDKILCRRKLSFSLNLIYGQYCLLVRYLFSCDYSGTSQAVFRNIWYIKSTLWKIICLLLGWWVISAQAESGI